MAGFMAGFGSGFSRSFSGTVDGINERNNDAFKMAYDKWTKQKAAYSESESEWKRNLAAGEDIAKRYGAPPGASLKAAEWLSHGWTLKEVDEMVKNTDFTMATPEVATANAPETPEVATADNSMLRAPGQPAPSPVDDQMTQSGLASPAAEVPDPMVERKPATQDGGLLGGMFGPEGIFKNAGKSPEEKAASRVMDTAGVSQEEFDQVNKGFTPPDTSGIQFAPNNSLRNPLEEFGLHEQLTDTRVNSVKVAVAEWEKSDDPLAQAKAARFRAMEPMIDARLEAEEENDPETALKMNDILKNVDSTLQPITEQRAAAYSLAQQATELTALVQEYPEVLSLTGAGAAGIESAKTELVNLIDFVRGSTGDTSESSLQAALDEMESNLIGGGKAPEVASAYRQFVASAFRLSYAGAAALGSSGRDLSDKELALIKDAILVSNNPEDFTKNLRNFANERWAIVDTAIETQKNGGGQIGFALDDKDAGPYVEKALRPMSEFYNLPAHKDVLAWMNGKNDKKTVTIQPVLRDRQPENTGQPNVITVPTDGSPIPRPKKVGDILVFPDGTKKRWVGGSPNLDESWEDIQ